MVYTYISQGRQFTLAGGYDVPATATETAVQTHRCCICHERKPAHQFSVATGICLECFDRSYGICEECGAIVYHRGREITRSTHRRARYLRGQVVCNLCAHPSGRDCDSYWTPTPLNISVASYTRIGSKRKFGVEIETSRCSEYQNLCGRTHWGAKDDCSISGLEFDSPILYGDEGLEQIEEILAYGRDHGWEVNHNCGCHTHYDMRDESRNQLLSIMYAYSKSVAMWARFVPPTRLAGSYCHLPAWYSCDLRAYAASLSDDAILEDILHGLELDRYELVNFTSYWNHTTFEVRMLEGTVDPDTICKWITIQCRFIDAVRDMSFDEIDEIFGSCYENDLKSLAILIGDSDLIDWLDARNARFSNRSIYHN